MLFEKLLKLACSVEPIDTEEMIVGPLTKAFLVKIFKNHTANVAFDHSFDILG